MRTILALVLLLLSSSPVLAKCGDRFFVFAGSVVDDRGEPAVGALVGVSWSDRFGQSGPAMTVADGQGRYSVPVSFQTYSGTSIFRGDKCKTVLQEVSVAAYTRTHRSSHLRVEVGSQSQINVPELRISTEIKQKPLFPSEIGG
jgi:hypothetical protein